VTETMLLNGSALASHTCSSSSSGNNGRDLIPLTAAESRRLFNLHVPVTHPPAFHQQWLDWRRYRQAAARKSHYARRLRDHGLLL
jgi:hypothetical protein